MPQQRKGAEAEMERGPAAVQQDFANSGRMHRLQNNKRAGHGAACVLPLPAFKLCVI